MPGLSKFHGILIVLALLVTGVILACGEEATPTPAPTAAPTATPDIGAAVQQAIQQAIAAIPTQQPGISAEDIPSIEDIASLVQAAVAAAAPEGTSAAEIQAMVQAAVQAAAQPGVTTADLQAVVQSAVDQAVQQAVSRVTPVATPEATATATPTPEAMMEPTGVLDVAFADIEVPQFLASAQNYISQKYDGLVTHEEMFGTSPDGSRTIGRLVESWETSPDGLTWTFHLREGVPWHKSLGDWGNFNADDMIWTLQDAGSEASIHAQAGPVREVFLCDGCTLTKVDENTARLVRPIPTIQMSWISRNPLGGLVMHSKRHFDAVGESRATLESVGTGPWEMVEARAGQFRHVKAVQNHWRKTPEWAEMIWWEIQEESTRVANFLTGQLDTASLSLDGVNSIKLENQPSTKYQTAPGGMLNYLLFHGQQYYPDAPAHTGDDPAVPLGEGASYTESCNQYAWISCNRDTTSLEWEQARKLRQAMMHAIDRQKLVNAFAYGDGTPWYLAVWFNPGRQAEFGLNDLVWEYDPARARSLLAEAGFADGFELPMALVPRGASGFEPFQAVASMWEEVGITVNQEVVPNSVWRPQRVRRVAKGVQSYPNPPATPEPLRHYSIFWTSISGFNQGFEHPDYEAMVNDALQTYDDDVRWAKQAELARWMFNNVMTIPLYLEDQVWPLGPDLDTWHVNPATADFLNNWENAPHR